MRLPQWDSPTTRRMGVVPAQGCRLSYHGLRKKRITVAAERTLAAACKMMTNFVCRNTMMICGCPNGTAVQARGCRPPRGSVGLSYPGSRM